MEQTALLVIDVQQSFEQRDYWRESHVSAWQNRQSALINSARQHNWPVIFIYHNADSGVFSPVSGFVKPIAFIDRHENDPVFNKRVHNALTDSGLQEHLQSNGIEKLLISGIRTEQCCETTARVSSDFGYAVDFVLDATLTFGMQHPSSNEMVSAEDISSRTELVLANRFAKITCSKDYDA